MLLLPEVAARLFDTDLMIDAGKLGAILTGIGARIVDGGFDLSTIAVVDHMAFGDGRPSGFSPLAGRLSDRVGAAIDRAGQSAFDRVGSVAVIPIEGTLVHKGAYVGMLSGRTSYQGLQTQVTRAMRDPAVKGVAFEVDSFGGEAAGAFETAAMIAALSAAKPTIAILTDFAASAGYLLASAARQIIIPPTGMAGSIGVITMHADFSQQLEKSGIKVTVLAAGKHKSEGNPYMPLGEDVKARTLNRLENGRQRFAAAVGSHRGDRFTAAAALATEAAMFDGEEAVKKGLADAVGSPSAAFAAFVDAVNKL